MAYSVLLTSLPGVSLQVAPRADSASHQHPNIRVLDFHRLERAYFAGDRGALGKSSFSASACPYFSCIGI